MSGPDPGALAEQVEAKMAKYLVPGVAVGVLDADGPRAWGFGSTNVDHPLPVEGDTVFEIASITKTMTATVAARLAAEGKLDLDAPVRKYLPEFAVADPGVSARVTVRDLFTHTAGWFGEHLAPTGRGDDAIAKGVAAMAGLEQLAPAGVFSYNNVSLIVAGRVIEVTSGRPYRDAVRDLLFAPLGMTHSAFDAADVLYERLAAGHTVRDGAAVRVRARLSESTNGDPVGGVRSTANDLLRYARFHLGDGTAPDGTRLLPARALAAMREPRVQIGPAGHVGLAWFLDERGGVRTAGHGGATVAHMSQLTMVPERGAAFVILTNGANGVRICAELQEWLLRSWLGLAPRPRPAALEPQPDVRPFAGRYWAPLSDIELAAEDGALVLRLTWKGTVAERPTPPPLRLAFIGPDTVAAADPSDAPPVGDFLRGPDGSVAYFRWGSRARKKIG
ncbi:MAG TPA: serine hydrolase domain-containing protein [Patescibacteria group bacterium]|nr:serine hydrolase domain-containing protein [Patescibacteria group bacterium]